MTYNSKFDEDSIHGSIMQGQIQWNSGYVYGRSEIKREILKKLDQRIIDVRKRNDEDLLNELSSIKRMIESS